jgi:hypothetical protein
VPKRDSYHWLRRDSDPLGEHLIALYKNYR